MRTFTLILLAFALAGCSIANDDGAGDPTPTASPQPTSHPDGPLIANLLSDLDPLYPGGAAQLTATVTDPQGASDIAGGVLVDTDGNEYGTFSAVADDTFVLAVSWEGIHGVSAIEFESTGARDFVARFTDNDGHVGASPIRLGFHCEPGLGAEEGRCVALLPGEYWQSAQSTPVDECGMNPTWDGSARSYLIDDVWETGATIRNGYPDPGIPADMQRIAPGLYRVVIVRDTDFSGGSTDCHLRETRTVDLAVTALRTADLSANHYFEPIQGQGCPAYLAGLYEMNENPTLPCATAITRATERDE